MNRRHKPGRAFERTFYRFDILSDYGAFRDLQRHRLLTIEWQPLGTRNGYTEPAAIAEAGALADWRDVMDRSARLLGGQDAVLIFSGNVLLESSSLVSWMTKYVALVPCEVAETPLSRSPPMSAADMPLKAR